METPSRPPRYESLFALDQTGCARSHLAIDRGALPGASGAALPGASGGALPGASAGGLSTGGLSAAGDRLVVVHVVPPTVTRDPAFIPLFTARASALLRMSHPNLVRTLDFVADRQRCQWVSEFVQGHTLASLLAKKRGEERALTLRQHLTILCEVLRGLEHAHRLVDAQGVPTPIVHRHLSPSSVLVSYEGQVKVTDAVLCAALAVTGGRCEEDAERLAYQAPECCSGGADDPRSDIFAVGALLWEAVCGRSRPVGASLEQAREMCSRAAPPDFEGAPVTLSPTLIAITRRALAKDPGERYQSAREFLLALEAQMPLAPANRDRGSLFAFMCSHFYEEHAALQRLLESRALAAREGAREGEAEKIAKRGAPSPALPARSRLVRGALGCALAVGAVFAFFVVRPERGSTRGPETIVQRLHPISSPAETAPPRIDPSASGGAIGLTPAASPTTSAPSAAPAPTAASTAVTRQSVPPPSVPGAVSPSAVSPNAVPAPPDAPRAREANPPPAPTPTAAAEPGGLRPATGAGSANDARTPAPSGPVQALPASSQTRSNDFSLAPRTRPEEDDGAGGKQAPLERRAPRPTDEDDPLLRAR